jgi:mannosyltransferase
MKKFQLRVACLTVLLLATATRLYRLDYQSLWADEGNSLSLARASFGEIAARTAFDIHPPFYYWLLKIWVSLLGESEFGLRSLSAALGVLLVGVIYGLGRKFFGHKVGLAAAFVAALAPFQVYYAQETRMYMLLTLLGATCIWLAVEAWDIKFKRFSTTVRMQSRAYGVQSTSWTLLLSPRLYGLRGSYIFGYITIATLGLYTQYAFPLILLAINVMAWPILWPSKRRLWIWLGLQVIPFILYLPWLPVAFRQITTWPSLVEAATPGEISLTLLRLLSLGPSATAVSDNWLFLFGGMALFGLIDGLRREWGKRRQVYLLILTLLWLLLPAGLTAALFRPAYLKIFLLASPAFCLLIGLGIVHLARLGQRSLPGQTYLPYLAALLITIPSYFSLNAYYTDPAFQRDNYRGIAAFISAVATKDDAVIIHAPGQQEVFSYYYPPRGEQPSIHPLPRQRPMDPTDTIAELEALTAQAERIYGIFWATEEADPDGLIEGWLNQRAYKANDTWFGNVRLVSYATSSEALEIQEVDFRLGEDIRLKGYGISQGKIAPGEILQISLIWEPDGPLTEDYTVFVQLLDEANHVVGQRDAQPLIPTTAWRPGQPITDNHGLYLEPGTPPTPLRLIVGLYDSATGARVPSEGGGDFIRLGSVLAVRNPSPLPLEAFRMQQSFDGPPLLGYDLYKLGHASDPETPLQPGDPLHLNLYWQTSAVLPAQDVVDLRLINGEGEVAAAWQQQVAGVNYPMAHWAEGEIVRGQYDLFLTNVPPGFYHLEIALEGEVVGITRKITLSKGSSGAE